MTRHFPHEAHGAGYTCRCGVRTDSWASMTRHLRAARVRDARPTSPDLAPGDDPTAGPWSLERVQAELSWRAGC